jgi:hypothetical protein
VGTDENHVESGGIAAVSFFANGESIAFPHIEGRNPQKKAKTIDLTSPCFPDYLDELLCAFGDNVGVAFAPVR